MAVFVTLAEPESSPLARRSCRGCVPRGSDAESKPATRGPLLGAMFLMATSAIGPGFITQTTQFTAQLGAAFAFAILVSVLVDVALQLNVWRVIGVSGLRAQELGNRVAPGLGHLLALIVALGGLVFNVGNVAGAGLGLDALLGLPPQWGGALSAALAIGIFLSRRAGVAMDRAVVALGFLMIALTGYVALVSDPPVGAALRNAVLPDTIDFLAITTLVGGTVGGYITYAGAHRLVDAGVRGAANVDEIARASVVGVLVTGRDAGAAVPCGARRRRGRRAARGRQSDRVRIPGRGRRVRFARIRARAVGGGAHLGDRRLVHVRFVPREPASRTRAAPHGAGGRLHRRLDAGVPVRRRGTCAAADLRRRIQRADPAGGRGGDVVGGAATARPAGRLSLSTLAGVRSASRAGW